MRTEPWPAESVVGECLILVAPAEQAFTSRWRLSTLKRVDAELHDLLIEQRQLYDTALVTGSDEEAREQSAAMVRGWRAACQALEQPLQPDDAYFAGSDLRSGMRVVIGWHPASSARVQADPDARGINTVFVTPDEVARLMGGLGLIASVKQCFPNAEVVEQYSDERAA